MEFRPLVKKREPMRIGFTGTREGMTDEQKHLFRFHIVNQPLDMFGWNEFRHGDCVGADSDAHTIILDLRKLVPFKMIGHPSDLGKYRAHREFDEINEVKPPLTRNWEIVKNIDVLIACPSTAEEQRRSGTWTTVRYAR